MNIRDNVQEIFKDIFDDETLEVKDETSANDIEDWDSLAHVNLVVAMEKQFDIKIALGELEDLKNVGEMIALIEKKVT